MSGAALVYKVVGRAEWDAATRAGVFEGVAIDHRDGYIHLSSGEQLETTLRLYFAERDDLVIVALAPERFGDALKWEPSRGGALFPHLYAKLPLELVAWSVPFSSRELSSLGETLAARS